MRRRAVVLAILGLAACVGDQPTEPTYGAEAASFQTVLPPIPAPPTVLTGELPANEGGPSQVDLGDYESPVYAKVTISGLLGYQGAGGYLPGAGQIDASGVVIQNQCDLMVVARSATGPIYASPSCPSQPRQIDTYTHYAVVNGHVDAYRTTGPPGSCWKYPAPCIHFTGSQSITVEPQEGVLVLTPSKTLIPAGGTAVVSAKGVLAADPTIPVPWRGRVWSWKGEGPVVGPGPTTVCAAVSGNDCYVVLSQSGYVVLEAIVNGKLTTGRAWITVEGGASPPPPPDSLPGGGDGDGGDGDGGGEGGGGGGGCGTCCGDSTSNGLHLAACNPPEVDVQLLLTCTPGTLVRTDQVSCEVTGTPSVAFTLDSASFLAGGIRLRDVGGYQVAAGASFKYVGPALLSTAVQVWGTLDSAGVPVARSAATSFSVTPRSWAELDALWPAPGIRRYTLDPPPVELDVAPRRVSPTRLALYPGLFETVFPDWAGLIPQVLVAPSGPNRGLTYLGKEVHFFGQPMIYTTPLFSDPGFLGDQNGGMGGALPRCTLSQFRNAFEPEVERHEGVGQRSDSHWGVQSAELAKLGLNQRAEALVLLDPGNADPIDTLSTAYERWRVRTLLPLQAQFDVVDRPRVPQNAGCEIDLDRNDP